ncbi:PP2C family protein-serine/threonine phosphatase [Nonomuraea jabiensis]|uniref:PP2C family protein-serine/threonine phosphatase n=1 Tax=Nonomuraea jabiensis TaxID=882448 RepID=UPI0036CD90AE
MVRLLTIGAFARAARLSPKAAGDRYLLCSDGLSAVVPAGSLRAVLTGPGAPQQVLDELVERAYAAGAPDNIACVVADVVSLETPADGDGAGR